MKQTRLMMGMPITVEVVDDDATEEALNDVFAYFEYVDSTFSTYREDSEISRINQKQITLAEASAPMQTIFALSEETRQDTNGYFDIYRNGRYDPSGLVKGWSIYNAASLLYERGYRNYYVDAGGDIQTIGRNAEGQLWRVGIRNPFNMQQMVKVLSIGDGGVATSGTYVRGQHIYNPRSENELGTDIVSLTVVGANVFDADRFATAAFAMGSEGIFFIERLEGFEAYQIDRTGRATFTSGFERYISR